MDRNINTLIQGGKRQLQPHSHPPPFLINAPKRTRAHLEYERVGRAEGALRARQFDVERGYGQEVHKGLDRGRPREVKLADHRGDLQRVETNRDG